MKKILTTVFLLLALFPVLTFASEKEYNTLNFKETLDAEKIEYAFDDYEESDDKITIYLFRGDGCTVCQKFLAFLNSITDEYGKYFNVESYEIFYDQDNNKLMTKVGNFMGDNVTGVPYIIIGDKTFPGYMESSDEDIKKAIKELYDSKERYDVFEEMEKGNNPATIDITPIILYNVLFTAIATITIIIVMNNKINKLQAELNSMNFKKRK